MSLWQKRHSISLLDDVLLKPVITEKSAIAAERGVYTFSLKKEYGKNEIREAVRKIYEVTPIKVRIINKESRYEFKRGRKGKSAGLKKALVYLKKGDKIEFV